MTEQKHTPGPWKATRRGIMAISPQTGRYGAVVCQPSWRGLEPDDVWLDIPREANVRLIEAAPDLLEVARKFRSAMSAAFNAGTEEREGGSANRQAKYQAQCEKVLAECRAAIAKAEGKE